MEKFNRAERRAQTKRLKRNRKNYWGYGRSWGRTNDVMNERELGKVVQNPQNCSNPECCGNPRRGKWKGTSFGRTLAEVIQEIQLEEQLKEVTLDE